MKKVQEGKNGFYCKDGLMSYASKYDILICMGGRFIGKSTEWQRFIISEFISKGKKFGIVKATEAALKEFAPDYWSKEWMEKWFPNYELMYKQKRYFIRKKDEGQSDKEGWEEAGYSFFLSRTSKKSTTTGQDIDYLLFEEFTNQEGVYLGNSKDNLKEPELLISLYQTLARGQKGKSTRHLKLIMLSNLYSINNPYFQKFDILNMITSNPNSIYQRFYKYDKGKLHYVLEFPQLKPKEEIIAADELDEGIKFQDYRNELKFTTDKPKKLYLQLTFDNKYIINISKYNDSIICFKDKNNKIVDDDDTMCFTCSKFKTADAMGINVFKNNALYKTIKTLFEKNKIYYDKLETFIQLTNILAY